MITLDTWWSPAAQCWRIEDHDLFTYYDLDLVVGHFVHRQHPAAALMSGVHDARYRALVARLKDTGVTVISDEVQA